ncbi:TetR/AcrR family transcriptional regulator [Streptomyces sp. NPDC091215]|uniref:TetR/AcrR family transcriptional regulator n=1 Tax=Streptomyces sp. NPDC091215 TaxID=3155192 RepID=UPI00342C7AF1
MTSPVKRPTGRHHGDLRRALEEAALALVGERGPHGFTLAEASRRAGVSVAAPYKHFADRDALLAVLAERGYRAQRERFTRAMATTEDPVEQLAAFAAAYVRFAAEERALFDVTFSAGLDKADHAGVAAAGEELLAALLPAAARVAPDADAAYDLLLRIASAAHGIAVFLRQGLFGVSEETLDQTADRAARTARDIARNSLGSVGG